jgi:hypothetical protein
MTPVESVSCPFPANAALDLIPLPGESIASSVWRFAWRNGLGAKELLRFCSHADRYPRNGDRFNPERQFNREVFAESTGWPDHSHEVDFVDASQRPYKELWWSSRFRYCPVCLENLYHSFWHQSLFLTHCPLDGAALKDRCYCCDAELPEYGFYRALLSAPYICQKCRGPISGVKVNLEGRISFQVRALEMKTRIAGVEQWWARVSPERERLEFLLMQRPGYGRPPWFRDGPNLRQWAMDQVEPEPLVPTEFRNLPRLCIFEWKVRLTPPDPLAWIWARRKSRWERLQLAQKVYRATIRRLFRAIATRFPCDESDYRRHLMLPSEDLVHYPDHCNLYLLALIQLRRRYETFSSLFDPEPGKEELDQGAMTYPFGTEFADRIRICWRAQFIAEYALMYWRLVSLRTSRKALASIRWENMVLCNASIVEDKDLGDVICGSVAIPAIDGLDLTMFP